VGNGSSACRCSAANLYWTRWTDDQYSSGAEPVHARLTAGLLSHSDRIGSLSGAGDDSETDADSEAAAGECEYISDSGSNAGQDPGADATNTDSRNNEAVAE